MKQLHHLCFTSHHETMFRDEEDHIVFFNCLAMAAFSTGSHLLADAEMSNHVHLAAFTDSPSQMIKRTRAPYSRYFNEKYGRKGRLGEMGFFATTVEGYYHIQCVLSYILRNGLHHGQAATSFGYPHSSIKEMFAEEIGWTPPAAKYSGKESLARFFNQHARINPYWEMDENGMLLRRSVMEIKTAESYYGTSRNFLYQMNRLSDESWWNEQKKDHGDQPDVNLESMEKGTTAASLTELLSNEKGWKYDLRKIGDTELCILLDEECRKRYGVRSVYQLRDEERERLFCEFKERKHLTDSQLLRCMPLR